MLIFRWTTEIYTLIYSFLLKIQKINQSNVKKYMKSYNLMLHIRKITGVFRQLCRSHFRIRNWSFMYVLFLLKHETFANLNTKFSEILQSKTRYLFKKNINRKIYSKRRGVPATYYIWFCSYFAKNCFNNALRRWAITSESAFSLFSISHSNHKIQCLCMRIFKQIIDDSN